MKREIGEDPAKDGANRDGAFKVEVRVREDDGELANAASERECAALRSAQGGVIRWIVLVAVLVIAGTYVGLHIGKGWVAADDGTLSQSALRVLQGQLPHRDFGEIYTGGLSFLHALAFRMLGVNLMSLRICVFLFFLAWVPAVYYIALRFSSPIVAGAVTLVAVVWSYPNYPAAMPSWYNLFFATFGAAALLRYLDVRTRRWLFVAGVFGGVSILIKVIGAYYVAGVLLFFAFVEQSENDGDDEQKKSKGWAYRGLSGAALVLFLGTVVKLVWARMTAAELYQFVLPAAVLVGLLLIGENGKGQGTAGRLGRMVRLLAPFLGGLLSPIAIFLVPYARAGGVWSFVSGVTTSAVSRSAGLGVVRPLGAEKLLFVVPLVGMLAAAMYWDKLQGKAVGAAVGLGGIVIAFRAVQSFDVMYGVWCSVAALTPVVVLMGAALILVKRQSGLRTKLERQRVMLLIALAGTCSLVQFPFAAAIYLCYMLPLTILAMVAIVSTGKKRQGKFVLGSVLAFYLVFGVVSLVPHYIYGTTWTLGPMRTMRSPRAGGLQIEEAVFFDDLAQFLRAHSPNGLMFAGNDCPALYFLSGLKNVAHDDGGAGPEEILKVIQSDELNLVVINDAPFFPGAAMQPEVKAEVAKKFPYSTRFGVFQVFWKK